MYYFSTNAIAQTVSQEMYKLLMQFNPTATQYKKKIIQTLKQSLATIKKIYIKKDFGYDCIFFSKDTGGNKRLLLLGSLYSRWTYLS